MKIWVPQSKKDIKLSETSKRGLQKFEESGGQTELMMKDKRVVCMDNLCVSVN